MSDRFKSLNEKLDIEKIVGEYTTPQNNMICCPFHNDTKPSMVINKDTNTLYCFRCKKLADCISYYSKMENLSQTESAKLLAASIGENFYSKVDPKDLERKEYVNNAVNNLSDITVNYLKARGIETDAIQKFSLGTSLIRGKHYVVQPVYDDNGKLSFYNQRCAQECEKEFSHRIEPGAPKKEVVGNLNNAKSMKSPLFVTEGMFDCIQAWQEGIACVCVFGADMSETQARKILNYFDDIALAFDNDEAGYQAAKESFMLIKSLSPTSTINFAQFEGKDLGEHLYNNDTVDTITFYEWSKKAELSYKETLYIIKNYMPHLEKRKNSLMLAQDHGVTIHDIFEELQHV